MDAETHCEWFHQCTYTFVYSNVLYQQVCHFGTPIFMNRKIIFFIKHLAQQVCHFGTPIFVNRKIIFFIKHLAQQVCHFGTPIFMNRKIIFFTKHLAQQVCHFGTPIFVYRKIIFFITVKTKSVPSMMTWFVNSVSINTCILNVSINTCRPDSWERDNLLYYTSKNKVCHLWWVVFAYPHSYYAKRISKVARTR